MLLHIALLFLLFRHEEYLETTFEKAESYCTFTVVGNSHRAKSGNWTPFEKDPIDPRWTSFKRSGISFEDPVFRNRSSQCNGKPTMEVQNMPETGKGQSTLLSRLRTTLEYCSGPQLCTGKQSLITQARTIPEKESMVGGPPGWMEQSGRLVQCMARTISEIAKKPTKEEERQRQREGRRKTTARGEKWCQRRTYLEAASPPSCLAQAKCPLEFINWGKCPIETVDDFVEEKQSGPAHRSAGTASIGASRRYQTADQNAAFGCVTARKLQENIEGAQPSETEVALPMVKVLGGVPHPMEWLRGQLSGAGRGTPTEDRGGKTSSGEQQTKFQGMPDSDWSHYGAEGLGHRGERRGRLHPKSDKSRRGHETNAGKSGNNEKPDGDRSTKYKEEKSRRRDGTKGRSRRWWWTAITAAFSQGRQMSTPVIICQGQLGAAWLHSATMLDDFLTPWSAADKAADLALEFGYYQTVKETGSWCRRTRTYASKSVSFSDNVNVAFFNDEVHGEIQLPRDTFEGTWNKPWRLAHAPRCDFSDAYNGGPLTLAFTKDSNSGTMGQSVTQGRPAHQSSSSSQIGQPHSEDGNEQRDLDGLSFWLNLLFNNVDEDLHLVTYGISTTNQGRRDCTAPADAAQIRNLDRQLWRDVIQSSDLKIDVVTPQPRLLMLKKYLVLLVSSVRGCPLDRKPVLADTRTPRDSTWTSSDLTAQYLIFGGTFEGHLLDLPYGRLCEPHGLRRCDLMLGGAHINRHQAALFPAGALARLNIHDLSEHIHRYSRYFPNFEEFALEVIDRVHNGYGILRGAISLRIFGPMDGSNTFVDLHLTPGQLLNPQSVWGLIRRTFIGLRGEFEVNLLQPQVAVWSDTDGRQPLQLALSANTGRDMMPTVIQIVNGEGILVDFRFVLIPRGYEAADLVQFLQSRDWWTSTLCIAEISTFGPLTARTITRGRVLRVIVRSVAEGQPDFTGLLQTSLGVKHTRLSDERDQTTLCSREDMTQNEVPRDHLFEINEDTTWLTRLIETLHQEGTTENEDEGRVIYIRTWYMDHNDGVSHESRVVRLTEVDDIWWWQQDIAEAWQDLLPRHLAADFQLVHPRPPRTRSDEATTEHVILSVGRDTANTDHEVAGIISHQERDHFTDQFIVSFPSTLTSSDFVRRMVYGRAWATSVESIFLNGQATNDEPLWVRHGTSWITTTTISADELYLMQRSRPTSTARPAPVPTHFFGRLQSYAVLWIRDENPSDVLTEHWELPMDGDESISDLHPINDPPDFIPLDSGVAYIVETGQDRYHRMHEDDVLILFHLIFLHERSNAPTTRFRTTWAPRRASYQRMMQHLRSGDFCNQPGVTCQLFFNGVRWPSDDQAIRHFRSGDYLKLTVDSNSKTFCDLRGVERADRSRRLYTNSTSSDSNVETPSQDQRSHDSEDEREEPRRSRSRSGHREDDRLSLLQTKATIQRVALADITNVDSDKGAVFVPQPHVLDRWCAEVLVDTPASPVQLQLNQLIEPPRVTKILRVWNINAPKLDDFYIEPDDPEHDHGIHDELGRWGIYTLLGRVDVSWIPAQVITTSMPSTTGQFCIYIPAENSHPPVVMQQAPTDEHIVHMQRLCEIGLCKAVILQLHACCQNLQLIHYADYTEATFQPEAVRPVPSLPPRIGRRPVQKISQRLSPKKDAHSSLQVNFPFPTTELQELFGSADGILRTEIAHLPLTEEQMRDIVDATNRDADMDSFDRFLIFVDGSSDPVHRHHVSMNLEIPMLGLSQSWVRSTLRRVPASSHSWDGHHKRSVTNVKPPTTRELNILDRMLRNVMRYYGQAFGAYPLTMTSPPPSASTLSLPGILPVVKMLFATYTTTSTSTWHFSSSGNHAGPWLPRHAPCPWPLRVTLERVSRRGSQV